MSDVDDAIRALEGVEWRRVPGVSAETAAVFTQQLVDAKERGARDA